MDPQKPNPNTNRELLISRLETLPQLDARYESILWVNQGASTGQKRGAFSLVFRAYDRVEDKFVALKFFDPDPRIMQDQYRLAAFDREPQILRALLNERRCLQLVQGMSQYNLEIPIPESEITAVLPCKYFAVEWLDEDIDDFFERQDEFKAREKLLLLNDVALSVEALHRHEIFHRDIKADNLRSYTDALKRIVVAIDLGTAARFDSEPLLDQYAHPVGHLRYTAPETRCGLASHRMLAPSTDIYAMGCLLYELFNKELFDVQVKNDSNYMLALAALSLDSCSEISII